MNALTPPVTLDTVLDKSGDVLFQEIGGEAVLLDLASEHYFGLDPVGTRIWELIDGISRLGEIQSTLGAEYDAVHADIGRDVLALASRLLDAGLVRAT